MTTIPYSPTEITALRSEMTRYGVKLSHEAAWQILRKVGNRPLCVDALLMSPKPSWLKELLGETR